MTAFRVLLWKALREQSGAIVFSTIVLSALFVLGGYLFRTFGGMSAEMFAKVSPELIAGMFGGGLGGLTPLETWLITLFVHPVLLVVLASVVIASASRAMAGEIDEGTVDLLLSYPVSRSTVVVVVTVLVQIEVVLLCSVVLMSLRAGLALGGIDPPSNWSAFVWVTVNLWALYFAASGIALLISAWASERGVAIARTLGFLVISFFLNLLASLWDQVEWLRYVSIFNYHQPQPTVASGGPLAFDFAVLLLVGTLSTAAAFRHFGGRDINVA